MKPTPDNAAEDNGPGNEVLPTLDAAYKAMAEGLKACGHPDAIFTIVCLIPRVSDRVGYDVTRVVANIDPNEIHGFLSHIVNDSNDEPPKDPPVRVLSMAQARRLVAMLRAAASVPDGEKH